ncbi:MAG: RNA 2',3'-cyclic phosphodiesterase [Candidatus Velthaea sp.]
MALALPDRVRAALAALADRLEAADVRARFVPPANYHATLAFLGAVMPNRLDALLEVMTRVSERHAPFVFRLDCLGAFPEESHAAIVWAGTSATPPAYLHLVSDLRTELAGLDLWFEDRATPHVTLARAHGSGGQLPLLEHWTPIAFTAGDFALFESANAGEGVRYIIRQRFPLTGPHEETHASVS